MLVLSPEGVAAVSAALQIPRLQRTVNIALGSAVSTIGLTIPAVLAISMVTGQTVELGLEQAEQYLLLFTILVAMINVGVPKTHALQGGFHVAARWTGRSRSRITDRKFKGRLAAGGGVGQGRG